MLHGPKSHLSLRNYLLTCLLWSHKEQHNSDYIDLAVWIHVLVFYPRPKPDPQEYFCQDTWSTSRHILITKTSICTEGKVFSEMMRFQDIMLIIVAKVKFLSERFQRDCLGKSWQVTSEKRLAGGRANECLQEEHSREDRPGKTGRKGQVCPIMKSGGGQNVLGTVKEIKSEENGG